VDVVEEVKQDRSWVAERAVVEEKTRGSACREEWMEGKDWAKETAY
jgi:hypothetical protein